MLSKWHHEATLIHLMRMWEQICEFLLENNETEGRKNENDGGRRRWKAREEERHRYRVDK